MAENLFKAATNRILQVLARGAPGAKSLRVALHRLRGVEIGENVWIGYDVVLETSSPHLISIGSGSALHARVMIVAHFREAQAVRIGNQVTIGPGAIILPNVTIGDGCVVTAGSVVTKSIPPMTLVQGNPAQPVARITKVLTKGVGMREFSKHLRPIK